MLKLIHEGGVPVWFVVLFGLAALLAAVRYAQTAAPKLLGLIRGLSLATLFATLAGTAANLGQVFHVLSGVAGPEMSLASKDGPMILLLGLGESMSTAILGFALLALTGLFYGVGAYRQPPAPAVG